MNRSPRADPATLVDASQVLEKVRAQPRRLPPYPSYKPSGVEWVGDVPEHWVTWKVTHGFSRLSSGTTPSTACLDYYDGEVPWVTTSELRETVIEDTAVKLTAKALRDHSSLRLYPSGTLLFAMYGATIGRLGILGLEAAVNQACCAFVGPRTLYPRFVFYWLQMRRPTLIALSSGGGQPNLSQDDLRRVRIPAPPLDEQRAIAAFLDRETAKIDALVAKKRRLIELLQEKRTALISRAVMGESTFPEVRLKHFVDLLPGYAFESSRFSQDPDDIRLLRGVNVTPHGVDWGETVRWTRDEQWLFRDYQLRPGDIVFGMDRPWITDGMRVAVVGERDVPSLLLQRVARLRARIGLRQGYLLMILSSRQFHGYFEPILTGVSVPHISPEQILGFQFRLPPDQWQDNTCQRLAGQFAQIQQLINQIELAEDRLNEYRCALISAAVTGKIDVRGEVAA